MLYEISQVLRVFVWPFNLCWLSLILTLYLLKKNKIIWAKRVLWGVIIFTFIFSLPFLAYFRTRMIESTYPSRPIADYPIADAIVVLGGSTGAKVFPRHEAEEVDGSRLLPAVRLYHLQKAKIIIVTGGVPYTDINGVERTESKDMKEVLIDMGIPENAIIEENHSRNTVENALYTKKILEENHFKNILLVTAAVHMRRAMMIFNRLEIAATPVPCVHKATRKTFGVSDFLPEAGVFAGMNSLLKEFFGYTLTSLLPLKSFSK